MKAYLQVEVRHSGKKNTDYVSSSINLGGTSYFINLNYEALSVLLDMKVSEIKSLELGYKSKEFEIKL